MREKKYETDLRLRHGVAVVVRSAEVRENNTNERDVLPKTTRQRRSKIRQRVAIRLWFDIGRADGLFYYRSFYFIYERFRAINRLRRRRTGDSFEAIHLSEKYRPRGERDLF